MDLGTNYAEIDEDSYATPQDIVEYRGRLIEPQYPIHAVPEDFEEERIDASILRPDYAIGRGGGSRNKGRSKTAKRLTGPQRIEKHLNIVKNSEHLAETPQQRAERRLTDAIAEMNRVTSMVGRPRKGKGRRVVVSGSADPQDIAEIKSEGLTIGDALDGFAEELRAA